MATFTAPRRTKLVSAWSNASDHLDKVPVSEVCEGAELQPSPSRGMTALAN